MCVDIIIKNERGVFMKVFETKDIYENPLPQLKSRQCMFPSLAELEGGTIAASFAIGEAFESVDSRSYICFSQDGGKSFDEPKLILDFGTDTPITDYGKLSVSNDGKLLVFGYAFERPDPTLPLGNPETGGLLDDFIFLSASEDGGKSFSAPKRIDCAWGAHAEASAPITLLSDGSFISPITGFADWNGNTHGKNCGRAIISHDSGGSFSDKVICMEFPGDTVTCFEQRMCQLASGAIVDIGWNEDMKTGERLPNHYTLSYDGGKSWSKPKSTGVMGQSSSVLSIGGEKLLALHSCRRDTDRPGIYAYVVDLSRGEWDIIDEKLIWEPKTPVLKDKNFAEIFAYLKFGQPSAIKLKNGDILATHWYQDNGTYKVAVTKIQLDGE